MSGIREYGTEKSVAKKNSTWHPISHDFETLPVGEIRWTFVCSPDHPVAQCSQEVLTDDCLRQYAAINVEDTAVTLRKRTAWLLHGQREIVVPNLATKLQCHLKGVGIGFLPEIMVEPYLKSGTLITRKVAHPRSTSPVGIGWRKDSTGLIQKFLRTLFENRDPVIQPFLYLTTPPTNKV